MDFRGIYEDGVIRPSGEVNLPDGTEVEFQPLRPRNGADSSAPTPERLAELDRISRQTKTLDQLVAEQGTKPIKSIKELQIPGLEDEDVDEFLRSIRPRHRP